MPAGLVKQYNGVRPGDDFGSDLVEMELHGFAVAGRQHEGGAGSAAPHAYGFTFEQRLEIGCN